MTTESQPLSKDPTPEQIAERSAEIQAAWKAKERMKRDGSNRQQSYEVPTCRVLGGGGKDHSD